MIRWDAGTGQLIGQTRIPAAGQVSLSADGSRCCAAGQVFDTASGNPVGPPLVASNAIQPAGGTFLTPDGSRIAFSTHDRQDYRTLRCQIIDVATGKSVAEVALPRDARHVAARLTPDGSRLVVACNIPRPDNTIPLAFFAFDAKTGAKLGESALVEEGQLTGFELLDPGHALYSTGYGKLAVVDLATWATTSEIPDDERVNCRAFALAPGVRRWRCCKT